MDLKGNLNIYLSQRTMAQQIVSYKEFEPSNFVYHEPKVNTNGGKTVYLDYDDGNADHKILHLQTPKMSCPYGLSRFGEEPKDWRFNLDLSFRGMDSNESLRTFYENLEKLDEKLLEDASTNSMAWFKKKKQSIDVNRALYSPLIRLSRDKETGEPDGKWPATFKVKLPYRTTDGQDGRFQMMAFDTNKERIPDDKIEEMLQKGSQVQAILRCGGIWFANGKYGLSWRVAQLKVTPPPGISTYAFMDDGDDEEEELIADSEEEEVEVDED